MAWWPGGVKTCRFSVTAPPVLFTVCLYGMIWSGVKPGNVVGARQGRSH